MRIPKESVVLVLAAACGGSGPTGSGGGNNPPPGGQVVSVSMSDYRFTPDTVRIALGTTVRWSNGGAVDHTSTSNSAGGWNSGTLAPPSRPCDLPLSTMWRHARRDLSVHFHRPGTYGYHCAFHGVPGPTYQGMIGAIVVSP